MNESDCELDFIKSELIMINRSYQGDIIKGTRIQHGRGIFIEKENKEISSIYEGWRFKNKREIFGRLILKNGLVYEGEFKDNMPHGRGKVI